MRLSACLLLLLAAPAVQAQMYKCTEGGKTRFSDKPFADCRSQSLQGEVKAPAPAAEPAPPASGKPGATAAAKKARKAKVEVPKEVADADRRCAAIVQEHRRLQRSSDEASRERVQETRSQYNACR